MNWMQVFTNELQSISIFIMVINAIIHVIFAGAVAKDAGQLARDNRPIYLVSPMIWAFATLIGGVIIAAIYWFMHHLTLKHR